MIRIILTGASGRMGQEIRRLCEASEEFYVVAKVDKMAAGGDVLGDVNDFTGDGDVIVDFSHHAATEAVLDFAVRRQIPAVIATTGHTEEETEMIRRASEKVAVFHASNMSLGVALLVELAVKTAAFMPDADVEIVETHHNRKLDAPSGTALTIAKAIEAVREHAFLKCGRSGKAVREKGEIGIHAVRRGNIVGIHEVLVSTDTETVTLKHEAHSRALFAEGALRAAAFVRPLPPGLYDMNSIIRKGVGDT